MLIRMGCIVSQSLDTSVKETIDQNIASKPVFMVSKSWCPYCRKAKQVLARYSIPAQNITILEIDGDTCEAAVQDYMHQLTGAR